MKEIIYGKLLGWTTIKYEDELTTLMANYMPPKFSIDENNNLNNIRIDIKVKTFKLVSIKGKIPQYLNNDKDVENIVIIEKIYNEHKTPIFYKVLAHKYIIGDCFSFDIFLPSYFTIKNFLIIYIKDNYKIKF